MLRILIVTTSTLVIGCQARELNPAFVGEYQLLTRNGQELPAPIRVVDLDNRDQQCLNDLLSGTLIVEADATWNESIAFQLRCGLDGSDVRAPMRSQERGKVETIAGKPDTIVLVGPSAFRQTATIRSDELHLVVTAAGPVFGQTFTYRRNPN